MKAKFSDSGRLWVGLNDKNDKPIYQGDMVEIEVCVDVYEDDLDFRIHIEGIYTGKARLIASMGAVIADVIFTDLNGRINHVSGYKNIRSYRSVLIDQAVGI